MRRLRTYGLAALTTAAAATAILFATGQETALADNLGKVFVTNTPANPVPVREQNLDANGNIKVHEQGTANVNVVGTVTTQNAAPTHPFNLVGQGGTDGCDVDPPLPAGTRWFLTSVGGGNTIPVTAGPGDPTAGVLRVFLTGNGPEVAGPSLGLRSMDTHEMTFPQPLVLTSPAAGYCLAFEGNAGIVGVVVGYRQ